MRLLLLTFILAFSGLVRAQDLSARMDEYVASQVKARRFMGSVLLTRGGNVVLKEGLRHGQPGAGRFRTGRRLSSASVPSPSSLSPPPSSNWRKEGN